MRYCVGLSTDCFCHHRDMWLLSKSAFKEKKMDVHSKLMQNYKQVPEWWFLSILAINIACTLLICHYYVDQLQLLWWGVLLACGLAFLFTLPVGVITATTNQVRISIVCHFQKFIVWIVFWVKHESITIHSPLILRLHDLMAYMQFAAVY